MINEKITVTISEPWDFTSSDGDNKLIVEILTQTHDGFIVKCCSNFNGKTTRLLFRKRNSYGHYNIHSIDDSNSCDEIDVASLKFIMIGTMWAIIPNMTFKADYTGNPEQKELIYDTDGYGFFTEPFGHGVIVELALNYLSFSVRDDCGDGYPDDNFDDIIFDNYVADISGFCPYGEWIKTDCNVPLNRPGRLIFTNESIIKGHLYGNMCGAHGINKEHWPIYVNLNTGWVCVGDADAPGEAVEFIAGCVAVIDADSHLRSLWLKPQELPPIN